MGSNTSLGLISHTVSIPNMEVLLKALSLTQLPPLCDPLPNGSQGTFQRPVAQVAWVREVKAYFFVRLHPRLRYADVGMDLDGKVDVGGWEPPQPHRAVRGDRPSE